MSYVEDLRFALDDVWNKNELEPAETTDIFSVTDSSIFDGLLFFSNAVELMYYETGHEEDNESYAVGQLSLAEWKLPEDAKPIREIRHLLTSGRMSIKTMHEERKRLWLKYIINNFRKSK